MKIIFLDIDGVLNVYCESRDEFGCTFHKHFEDNLRFIIEKTDAKIVVSSTWRMEGLDVMQQMWKKRGLAGEVIDVTPNLIDVTRIRGYEIDLWLKMNKHLNVSNYCIIDDDDDMTIEQMPFFVKTSGNLSHPDHVDGGGYGLTKICAEKVVKILLNN